MDRALITGATGLIGKRLVSRFPRPVVLSRDPERARRELGEVDAFRWDAEAEVPPLEAFAGVDRVFHLAGETIAGRWTGDKKRRILDSRVLGTRNLVRALSLLPPDKRPSVLVSMSAVGFYGSRGDDVLEETAPVGGDFLAQVCQAWEAEARRASEFSVRVVCARTGLVLAREGGALAEMLRPFRLGAGGPLGDGRQWWPWIHIEDVVGLLVFAAEKLSGPVNVVSPAPVRNAEFTRVLGRVLGRPAILRAPAFALRLALGEFSEAVLGSQRALPAAAVRAGYGFAYPELEEALREAAGS